MARAVCAGHGRGRVWVDDVDRPTGAMIGTVENWLFAGKASPAFEAELAPVLQRICRDGSGLEEDPSEFSFSYEDPSWVAVAEGAIGDLLSDPRQYYELESSNHVDVPVPAGFELRPIDAEFLETPSEATTWINNHYLERSDFLERSCATAILKEGELACWCITDCIEGEVAEVGIETAEAFRRQGLAAAAVSANCAALFRRGVKRIGWHCFGINTGSIRTAKRNGFELVRDYPLRFRMLDALRHELVRGWVMLEVEKDAAGAAKHLERVLNENPEAGQEWHDLRDRAAREALGR